MKKFLCGFGAGIMLACVVGITVGAVRYQDAAKEQRAAEAAAAAARGSTR